MFKPTTPPKPRDTQAMLISGVAAVVFWLMNALNKDGYSLKVAYPLSVQYNDTLYIPTQPLPQRVMVNISGNGWSLFRKGLAFDNKPIKYPVNKPLKTNFINTSSLTALLSEQIKDVRVNYVVADTLDLEFDRKIKKKVFVQIDSANIPLKTRFVISTVINVSPRYIVFEGPETLLNSFKDTLHLKVPGKRIQDNYDEEIPIDYKKNPLIKASKEKVAVSFEVEVWQLATPVPKR